VILLLLLLTFYAQKLIGLPGPRFLGDKKNRVVLLADTSPAFLAHAFQVLTTEIARQV
jgi:hypothetical protein